VARVLVDLGTLCHASDIDFCSSPPGRSSGSVTIETVMGVLMGSVMREGSPSLDRVLTRYVIEVSWFKSGATRTRFPLTALPRVTAGRTSRERIQGRRTTSQSQFRSLYGINHRRNPERYRALHLQPVSRGKP
jgi:hypothetical protein